MGLITNNSAFFYKANWQAADLPTVDALIEVATAAIEKYCNRIFAAATYAEETDGSGCNQIFVRNPPINTLTSIQFVADTTTTVTATGNFVYKANQGEIRWDLRNVLDTSEYVGSFRFGYNNIIINYDGGFVSIPDPVKFVCAEMVMHLFDPNENQEAQTALKLGNYYVKFNDKVSKLTLSHRSMLSMYRIQPVVLP